MDTSMKELIRSLGSLVALALLVACDAETGVVGQWEAQQGEQVNSLVLEADSTFTMNTGGFTGTGTFALMNDSLRLSPEGALATVMPGGFSGSLRGDTLNLCSPSKVCTDFHRVEPR
jgi:hypothetical protein